MRAIYEPFKDSDSIQIGSILKIEGERAHHLIFVVRIKRSEEILVFDGVGGKWKSQIRELGKNFLDLELMSYEFYPRPFSFDLGIGLVKRDALEEILKIAAEMGIENFLPVQTQYSQGNLPSHERINRVIESALIQSNNPYVLKLKKGQSWKEFMNSDFDEYTWVIYFSSKELPLLSDIQKSPRDFSKKERILIFVGPEGGLSEEEEQALREHPKVYQIHLITPILRAPHAVACGIGYFLALWIERQKKI